MYIFQLNVRLAEGGAAGIALDLHRRALKKNIDSKFIYGYGKSGNKSASHHIYSNVIKNTSRVMSYINLLTFPYFNYDPVGTLKTLLKEAKNINENEVLILHFHVIHSYWINYHKLVKCIEELAITHKVKVVWTLHDHWALTGRCAFLNDCSGWKHGCLKCPQLDNYPPVRIDRASQESRKKTQFINDMGNLGCTFVSPSNHVADSFNFLYGEKWQCIVVNNGIDVDSEDFLISQHDVYNLNDKANKIAIVAHDLAYKGKTNHKLLNEFIDKFRDVEFNFFGKNSPFNGSNVKNHGFINDKKELMKSLTQMDALLFTSKVDNYPLILCETMSLGVPILAISSDAANEVLSKVGGKTFSEEDLSKIVGSSKVEIIGKVYECGLDEFKNKSLKVFSGDTMLTQYIDIYENF